MKQQLWRMFSEMEQTERDKYQAAWEEVTARMLQGINDIVREFQ